MLKGQTKAKLLLWSSASLLAISIAAPAVSFAQQNDPAATAFQSNIAAPLNTLNDAQKKYAEVSGMVSEMYQYGLPVREKAAQALEQIKSDVRQVQSSNKAPQDLLQNTAIAIDEAQTALTTDSAQAIAWSLETVGLQVKAIEAQLTGQNPPAVTASQERPTGNGGGTRAPQQASTGGTAEQRGPRVAEAEHQTGVTPQTPQGPNSNVETRISNERGQNGPMQQAAPEQPMQQSAQAQPAGQPGQTSQQPIGSKAPSAADNQPVPQQNALASMKPNDVVGKQLYDRNGNAIAMIQDAKVGPDGKIQAVGVDVGGFLGIGSRHVDVPADTIQVKGNQITSSMGSEQIRNLPHD